MYCIVFFFCAQHLKTLGMIQTIHTGSTELRAWLIFDFGPQSSKFTIGAGMFESPKKPHWNNNGVSTKRFRVVYNPKFKLFSKPPAPGGRSSLCQPKRLLAKTKACCPIPPLSSGVWASQYLSQKKSWVHHKKPSKIGSCIEYHFLPLITHRFFLRRGFDTESIKILFRDDDK